MTVDLYFENLFFCGLLVLVRLFLVVKLDTGGVKDATGTGVYAPRHDAVAAGR